VLGSGQWTSGQRFYVVSSATDANLHHIVTVSTGRLECDCPAGRYGRLCQHRALVHEHIAGEHNPAAVAPITHHDRETALPAAAHAPQRPFSVFKA
jgi:hypothetical protein